jgi:hypothetical protein
MHVQFQTDTTDFAVNLMVASAALVPQKCGMSAPPCRRILNSFYDFALYFVILLHILDRPSSVRAGRTVMPYAMSIHLSHLPHERWNPGTRLSANAG